MTEEIHYYLLVEDEAHGPFPRNQIVEGLMAGEIPQDTLATISPEDEWVPLSSIIQVAPTNATKFQLTTKIQVTETLKMPPKPI